MIYRLKFGFLLTSLWAVTDKPMTQRVICGILFHAFNKKFDVDDNCATRCKGCSRNISGYITEKVNQVDKKSIKKMLAKNLTNKINYPKGLIAYLRIILKNDDTVPYSDRIGNHDSPTKEDYLKKTEFNLEETIADFLIYTVLRNENNDKDAQESISKLNYSDLSNFIEDLEEKNSNFEIIRDSEIIDTPLKNTVESSNFEDVFTEVALKSLNIPNPNNIRAYLLNTNLYPKMEYDGLVDMITDNIYNYVYSRQEIENNSKGKKSIIANTTRALQKLREQANDDQLGQILIYIFLENILRAPKLMSKIEMNQDHIHGDGIFLNSLGSDNFQLVIGTSKLYDNPVNAVDKMIQKIVALSQQKITGSSLLLDLDFKAHFTYNELQNLRSVLKPTKNHHLKTNAFGMFIGYDLNVSHERIKNLSEKDIESYIKQCINKDLNSVINRLNQKIIEKDLQCYSFYVYIMPFSNAKCDSRKIMYSIRGEKINE
ncbi:DUF1837 domain-containing protein [Lactobacillus mellis]|uniref:HamA C-terminal domain-containing protein n=1 Tax=Bombilactobacillus mellis TaxID=1218508 RepID=UPI0015804FDB|nr:DUF1837 domain-containing protein [Bombilactobacillus mellis]NUG66269.1 DUF1837 domain-containing protein [Bombilactobacillus mellis]